MNQDQIKELRRLINNYGVQRYRMGCSSARTSEGIAEDATLLLAKIHDHIATLEQESAANLQRALVAEEKAQGMILVSREAIERIANIDAFNAPVGAAMEIKMAAQMMLQDQQNVSGGNIDVSREVG